MPSASRSSSGRHRSSCPKPSSNPKPVAAASVASLHAALGPWKERVQALKDAARLVDSAAYGDAVCERTGPYRDPRALVKALQGMAEFLDGLLAHFRGADPPVPDPDAADLSQGLSLVLKGAVPDPFRRALRRCDQLAMTRAAFEAARRGNSVAGPLVRVVFGNRVLCGLLDRGHSLETAVTELLRMAVAFGDRPRPGALPGDETWSGRSSRTYPSMTDVSMGRSSGPGGDDDGGGDAPPFSGAASPDVPLPPPPPVRPPRPYRPPFGPASLRPPRPPSAAAPAPVAPPPVEDGAGVGGGGMGIFGDAVPVQPKRIYKPIEWMPKIRWSENGRVGTRWSGLADSRHNASLPMSLKGSIPTGLQRPSRPVAPAAPAPANWEPNGMPLLANVPPASYQSVDAGLGSGRVSSSNESGRVSGESNIDNLNPLQRWGIYPVSSSSYRSAASEPSVQEEGNSSFRGYGPPDYSFEEEPQEQAGSNPGLFQRMANIPNIFRRRPAAARPQRSGSSGIDPYEDGPWI